MIIDIGPILYAVLILYTLAGLLIVTLLCAGIWAVKKLTKRLGSISTKKPNHSRFKRLPYKPVPQVQSH